MEREINLKYLFHEIWNKKKSIICIGIVLAVLYSGYSWMSAAKHETVQDYAAEAQLYLEKNVDNVVDTSELEKFIDDKEFESEVYSKINETINDIFKAQNLIETNIAFLECDEVLTQVVNDSELKNEKISIDEFRKMLYLRGKENGAIIDVNVVAKSETLSELLCSKLIEYGVQYLEKEDYSVSITKEATSMGAVMVELRESTADPRDKQAIITETTEVDNSIAVTSVVKDIILGFAAGVILMCVYSCVKYILLDKLVYAEEIEEYVGMPVIARGLQDKDYWGMYSNLNSVNNGLTAVHFISLKPLNGMAEVVEKFAGVLSRIEKNPLIIEYVRQDVNDLADMAVVDKGNYKYTQISDMQMLRDNYIEGMLSSLKEQYDFIIFATDDVEENPAAKVISQYTDITTIVIEKDTVKRKVLHKQKCEFETMNIKVSGVVFI